MMGWQDSRIDGCVSVVEINAVFWYLSLATSMFYSPWPVADVHRLPISEGVTMG